MKFHHFAILVIGFFAASGHLYAQDPLPEKVHTAIDKILDDNLAEVENTLIKEKEFDAKTVLLTTVPLENFIEDVLYAINRPAVIYPRVICNFIRDQFRQGKSREEIGRLLVSMQKQNKFEKMYVAEKQK